MGFSEQSTEAVVNDVPCGGQWVRDVIYVPMSTYSTASRDVVYSGTLTFPRPSYIHSMYVEKPLDFVNNNAFVQMFGYQWGLGSTYDMLNLIPQTAYQGRVISGGSTIRISVRNPNRLNPEQVACDNGSFCVRPAETTQQLPSTFNVEVWIYSCPAAT